MTYAGRHNIYEATIRRLVTQALEAQEQAFSLLHKADTEEQLIAYLQAQARELGHTPWPGEIVGGRVIEKRFGSWRRVLLLAGLSEPRRPNKPESFERVREETAKQKLLYRRRKAEKKELAQMRQRQRSDKQKQPQ